MPPHPTTTTCHAVAPLSQSPRSRWYSWTPLPRSDSFDRHDAGRPKPKKEKKDKKEDKKEDKKGEKGDAPADEAPAYDEKAEEAKKRAAEDKKAAEKLAAEEAAIKRAQELEAAGKKVSGGLHKFDASEVDINGGSATADDFMDAFGFGGDDAAPAEEAPAEAAPAYDEAAEEAKKRAAEDKKAAEKLAAEEAAIKKAQELEAAGKKVSGGLHKFDASEVDINGGSATADDFLDAFGFE